MVNVSRDVISPAPQANADSGMGATRTGGKPAGPAYVARIQLNRDYMRVDGKNVQLQPGMTVTVDIRTGGRTILNYLLSPIARRAQESLHER